MDLKKFLNWLKKLISFDFFPKDVKMAYEKQTATAKYVAASLRIHNCSIAYEKEIQLKNLHKSMLNRL